MRALRRQRKFALLRISFLKMSAILVLPLTCKTVRVQSATHLQTEFSGISMCQLPLVVILWHHLIQALLSLYWWYGACVGVPLCDGFSSRCPLTVKSYYLRNTNNSFLSLSFFQTTDNAQTNTMVESFVPPAAWSNARASSGWFLRRPPLNWRY